MDLASLQIKISESGVEKAIGNLDKLENKAKSLVSTLEMLSKKFDVGNVISSGISLIGQSAELASTHVKTLRSLLDSLGVGKLSQLITAVNSLTASTVKASSATTKIKKDIEAVNQAEQKTAQQIAITNQQRAKASQIIQQTAAQQKIYSQQLTTATQQTANATAQATVIQNKGVAAQNNATTSAVRLANAHSQAAYHLQKHTQTWIDHIRTVTGGILLYQGIRSVMAGVVGIFRDGIQAVDEYEVSVIQIASILGTLAKVGDPAENFMKAKEYAEGLIPVLQQIDAKTTLNLSNLTKITEEMAKQGVVMDATNQAQIDGMTRIANVIALYSRNGQDVRQVQQEIRSALQGQHRDSDQLGKLLYTILGDRLKPMLRTWQEQGTTIEEIGKLLVGFGPAIKHLEGTWSAVTSSLKTTIDIVNRETLTPILREWSVYINQFNKSLQENKVVIADSVQNVWGAINEVIQIFIDNGWIVKTLIFVIGETFNAAATIIKTSAKVINIALQELSKLTSKAFGQQSQDEIKAYGTRWQQVSSFIAGSALSMSEIIITVMTSVKLLGNALITLNDIAAKTIFFGTQGNPLDAFNAGVDRQKLIFKEYAGEISSAQNDYLKRLEQIRSGNTGSSYPAIKLNFDLKSQQGGDGNSKAKQEEDRLERLKEKLENATAKQNQFTKAVETYSDTLNVIVELFKNKKLTKDESIKNILDADNILTKAFIEPYKKFSDSYDEKNNPFKKWYDDVEKIKELDDERSKVNSKQLVTQNALKAAENERTIALQTMAKTLQRQILDETGRAVVIDATTDSIINATQAGYEYMKQLEKQQKQLKSISAGLSSFGRLIGGNVGDALKTFSDGFNILGSNVNTEGMTDEEARQAQLANQINGYATIASGVGQLIGGKTGNAISSTASMASSGAILALALGASVPFGAIAGGLLGLGTALFGDDGQEERERAARDQTRQGIYNNMITSALSGGTESLALLQAGGWKYNSVKNLDAPSYLPGYRGTATNRLFEDRDERGLADLSNAIAALDTAGKTVSEYMTPALLRDLDQAKTLLDYTIATVGNLGGVTEAYWAQVTEAITGIKADSISSFISDAITSNVSGNAGKAFSDKFEESIATAIRNMAISNLVNTTIMPMLQPAMTSLVSGLISGPLTSTEMAEMMNSVKAVTNSISPMINALSEAFNMAGVGSHATSTQQVLANTARLYTSTYDVKASNYSSYSEYRSALSKLRGYASGGVTDSNPVIVGENGWEIVAPPIGSRVFSNSDSRAMLDQSSVVEAIGDLKQEIANLRSSVSKNIDDMRDVVKKWDKDGMPKERSF